MAHIVKQNRPIEKKLIPKAEALALFAAKGQTLKCQLIDEKAGRHRPVLHDGRVHRLLPGPAPALHREDQGVQAQAVAVAVLLEGQGGQPGDAAHLRLRLLHQGRAGRSTSSGSKRPSGATTASWAASSTSSRSPTRPGAGLILWHPEGRLHPEEDRGLLARRSTSQGGYDIVFSPAHREARPLEDQRATPSTTRRTCTRRSTSRTSSTS